MGYGIQFTSEAPYTITGNEKIAVTATSQAIDFKGKTAILNNVGTDTIYITNKATATVDDYPIVAGVTTWSLTGKLSMVSAGTSDVRILYVDPMALV